VAAADGLAGRCCAASGAASLLVLLVLPPPPPPPPPLPPPPRMVVTLVAVVVMAVVEAAGRRVHGCGCGQPFRTARRLTRACHCGSLPAAHCRCGPCCRGTIGRAAPRAAASEG
jgi:hypothetical protein